MIRVSKTPSLDSSVIPLFENKSPVELIQALLKDRYSDAPNPNFKWCRGYYERCATYTPDGGLAAIYFPPAINYVLDLGYENLVIFKNHLQCNVIGDATFPHWEKGVFYSTRKEEANDILYPFTPRDLIVGTNGIKTKEELTAKLNFLDVTVEEKIGDDSYTVTTSAFKEDSIAAEIHKLPEIRFVERNGTVRIIDIVPGWLIDRIF